MPGDNPTRTDSTHDRSNVLLAASRADSAERAACKRLLGESAAGRRRVLGITYGTAPTQWHSQAVGSAGGTVVDTAVISVGDLTRAASGEGSETPAAPGVPTVRTIRQPTDLVGLGLEVESQLDAWANEGDDADIVVCLDSVNDLLDHVDAESAHRFLSRLAEAVAARDARAHYHLDPAVHDDRTVDAIRSAFDHEVDLHQDGGR